MEIARPWDKTGKYTGSVLQEYTHWVAEMSYRQHTLGCFILFCKREIQGFSELTVDELASLRQAMKDVEGVLLRADGFVPNRFNYFQMGNQLHHLHIHGIPRYASDREFSGRLWRDESYGYPPIWVKEDATRELITEMGCFLQPYFLDK